MATVRDHFVATFGEDEACRLESAAEEHGNGVNDANRGSDPFKWVLSLVIGYQCAEADDFRKYHGIVAPWSDIKRWIVEHGQLSTHDGDVDYISVIAGVYNEYMGAAESAA